MDLWGGSQEQLMNDELETRGKHNNSDRPLLSAGWQTALLDGICLSVRLSDAACRFISSILLDYTSGVQVGINHCYYYLKSQDSSITTKVTITSILTEEKPL